MKHLIASSALLTLTGILPALADAPANWVAAQGSYETCQQTGGEMQNYFESVELTVDAHSVTFLVETNGHGQITTVYHPDGLVRRGSDFHYLKDGTVLGPIPSHEATFWDIGELVKEEVTYLPGKTYAEEENRVALGDGKVLNYVLHVDGKLWFSASCS